MAFDHPLSSALAVFICLCFVIHVNGDLKCDGGWTLYFKGETCLRHYKSPISTWQAARDYCGRMGGDLVRIDDVQKQTFFNSFHKGKNFPVWLGLRRTKRGARDFRWLDDTSTAKYSYWSRGEPNNYGGKEDCISTWKNTNNWNDGACAVKYGFVCEKLAYHATPRTCPTGWALYNTNCFRMYSEKQTWQAGRTLCRSEHGDLATIPDAGTTDFINTHFTTNAGIDVWIGLNNIAKQGTYRWAYGNKMFTGSYKNWARGQPDNRNSKCTHLWGSRSHQWDDAGCESKLSVLCQRAASRMDIYCPNGWDMFYQQKKCVYMYNYERYTWKSARQMCQNKHGDLVKITDDDMNNYVMARVGSPTVKYWIGLHKNANSYKTTWLDEVTKPKYSMADLNAWKHGTEYCGVATKGNKMWGSDKCTTKHAVICERKAYASIECPPGYTKNTRGSVCYKVSTDTQPWETARTTCQADGGDLVKIVNKRNSDFIWTMLKKANTSPWIGLHDRQKDNKFQWLDSTKDIRTPLFTNWARSQPNDTQGLMNCVQLNSKDGRWYDDKCETKRNYLCEHAAVRYGNPPKTTDILTCPDGWLKQGTKPHYTCIRYGVTKLTWKNARKACQKSGGDLIKIDSNDLASSVNKYLVSIKATVEPYIGLSDNAQAGQYVWLDEEHKATFTNWNGQPSGAKEHCATIIVNRGQDFQSEWNDVSCSSLNGYICQQPATVPGSLNCGPGWEDYPDTDHCFRFSKEPLNWRQAQSSCKINGGDLASVVSPEEMLYLAGRLHSLDGDSYWSGGNDLSIGSGWQWTDHKPFGYFNWEIGEPNTNRSDNCISINKDNGRWVSSSCMEHKPSICKKLGNVLSHPKPTPFVHSRNLTKDEVWGCRPTWYKYRDSCYSGYVTKGGLTWAQANRHCHTQSSNLVAISDIEENYFLFSLLNRGFQSAWIGLNDQKRRLTFSWSDNVTPVTFTYWKVNQPSLNGLPNVCVGLSESSGRWADYDCNTMKTHFVCKTSTKIHARSEWDAYKGCTKGGKGYYDKCYRFYSGDSKSFDDAQKVCQTLGGNLATLSDRFIQAFVSSEMSNTMYWIGLSNTKQTATPDNPKAFPYTWTSGATFSYANWDREFTGIETHTCVALKNSVPLGLWHNYACDYNLPYVCEYPRPGYSTPVPITTTTSLEPCPAGFTTIGHMCYKAVTDRKLSWMDANSYCQAAVTSGGTLASVTSSGLGSTIKKQVLGRSGGTLWIGLSDRDGEGGYKWVGGEPFRYQNWGFREPNNQNNMEDCVQWIVVSFGNNKWNDFNCYGASNFICQAPRGTQLVTTLTPPTVGSTVSQCGAGSWTMYNGYCYMFSAGKWSNKKESWFDARDACHKKGAELASIGDAKENGYLTTLIGQNTAKRAWIGLNDFDEDVYKWVDGSLVVFLAWGKGEPNDAGGERCVTLDQGGFWNDLACNSNQVPYICKKRPGNFIPITMPTATPPMGGCPRNFYGMPGTSRCFQLVGEKKSDRKTFTDAVQACKDIAPTKKARLASIHSTIDQEFITTLIANLQVPAWIGFRIKGYSYYGNDFVWVDNTKQDYVHWSSGGYAYGGHCAKMLIKPKVAGEWDDTGCYDKLPFVCEYSKAMIFPTNVPNTKGCPLGYTRFQQACYKYVPTLQNWTASEAGCAGEGGHLATEMGGFDRAFIDLMVQNNEQEQLWIGLADNAGKNSFTWSSNAPVLYTSWDRHQPDLTQSCVAHWQGGKWRTVDCQLQMPSVCQYDLSKGSFEIPDIPGKCPSNVWTQYGDHCYFLETVALQSWPEASYQCTMLGGHLASVHSSSDAKIISMFLNAERVDAWIGIHRSSKDSSFTWSDQSEMEYFNWAAGSPSLPSNTASDKSSLNCVLTQGVDGKWTDTTCFNKHAYICKVKQIPVIIVTNSTSVPTTTTPTTTTTTTTSTTTPSTTTTSTTTTPRTTMPNKCSPSPCKNGICSVIQASFGPDFYCSCALGWTGKRCDQLVTTEGVKTTPKPTAGTAKNVPVTHFIAKPGNAQQTSSKSDSSGLASSDIAGIVVGVLCAIAIVVVGVFLFKRRQDGGNNSSTAPNAGFENETYDKKYGIELQPSTSSSDS